MLLEEIVFTETIYLSIYQLNFGNKISNLIWDLNNSFVDVNLGKYNEPDYKTGKFPLLECKNFSSEVFMVI